MNAFFNQVLTNVLGTLKNHGSSPPNFSGDLKISDQNNWGWGLSKKLNLGGGDLNLKGNLKFLGVPMNPQ